MISGVAAANAVKVSNGTKTSSTKAASGFSDALAAAVDKSQKKQSKSLDDIFNEASARYNVPVKLLKAVAKAESGFQADAVSCCGAQGIMQLMPSTAASLGVQNSFDPEQNIMGGAKYLSGLLSSFDGNAKLAVAAYNAGSGSVRKYGGVPPYAETQNYVKKVLGYAGEELTAGSWRPDYQTGVSAVSGTETSGTNLTGNGISGNDLLQKLGFGDLTFSQGDYQLFAKTYVKMLEQNALNTATDNAERKERHNR